jgi:hypothetical protein
VRGRPASILLNRGCIGRRPDRPMGCSVLKRLPIREDLKVMLYQSQETDNTFITSDGTSPYNSTRQWAVKRHYREDYN